jgi:hypothetical protein
MIWLMHIHLIDWCHCGEHSCWAILHLKPPSLGRGPLLILSRIVLKKTEPLKKNPVTHSHSRHTRMPSSRHVGGYLMLCREDCCCEEGLLSKQEEELLNHRNRKECGLDA